MVEIIKGSKTLLVSMGAYKNSYASAGWELKENVKPEPKPQKKEEPKKVEEPVEEVEEPEDEDDEDVEYVDPEELDEKPLEELDYEELKILAEYHGIDIKGMKSSKALRDAIKKARK